MIKTRYRANIKKDGAFWFIQIYGHENIFTQARSLEEIEPMTRNVIFLMLNIPEDSFEIELRFDQGLKSLEKRSRGH